jgi:hypothetical protein
MCANKVARFAVGVRGEEHLGQRQLSHPVIAREPLAVLSLSKDGDLLRAILYREIASVIGACPDERQRRRDSIAMTIAGLMQNPPYQRDLCIINKAAHIVILKERRISARTEESRFIKRFKRAKKKT